MKKTIVLTLLVILFVAGNINGQAYNIVIKGGHVIDPKNNIDRVMDVAVKDGKIALVADNIDTAGVGQIVIARGMYVTPGLIDIHTHVFWGIEPDHQYANGNLAIQPDGFTFRNGVTTIVDAGGAGWKNFDAFKRQAIDNSQTRVLAFLNISAEGMQAEHEQNLEEMDPKMSAIIARKYKNYIVGFKLAHYNGHDWRPTDRAIEAGRMAGNLPVMVDFGGARPPLSIEELFLDHFRPGDIFTHCYAELGGGREYVYDLAAKKVKPFIWEAKKRGVVFDVGHGGASFAFSQAIPSIKDGFLPNSISTDLHVGSMNGTMKDMLTTMTKFLAIGMNLHDVIEASTWNPAKEIQRYELGHLSVGAVADVAILNFRDGKFGLFDVRGYKVETDKKLECEMTIRGGKIVYDLNGITTPLMLGPSFGRGANNVFAKWYMEKFPGGNITPSNSINQEEFFRQYQKNPKYWDEAFAFLNNKNLAGLKPGKYVIDEGNVTAEITEGATKDISVTQWEAHREFNDLQYVIQGKEQIGVASVDDPENEIISQYTHTKDIIHFKNDGGQYYEANPDTFFIFSPLEMHRPSIKTAGINKVKKVVVKVRVP